MASPDVVVWEDEDFCEDDGGTMNRADFDKMSNKLNNDGYRIGKGQEEERLMQIGFDCGFERGMRMGRLCGSLFGTVRAKVISSKTVAENEARIVRLQTLLFEDIPEKKLDIPSVLSEIESILTAISPELVEAFGDFQSSFLTVSNINSAADVGHKKV